DMLRSIQQRNLDRNRWVKITMGIILVMICASMLLYLIPGLNSGSADGSSQTVVASVGGQDISVSEVQRQLNQAMRGQSIPEVLRGLYARQVLDQMIFQRALEVEAQRLGLRVTAEEQRERIKQLLPTAFAGDAWLKDRYTTEVQTRTGMTVDEFETFLRNEMLRDKFHQLVTDGITVSSDEIQQEFRRRNEKVQIEFALVRPAELASTIHPTDAELTAYFAKNSSHYQVPEKRSTRYAMLDLAKLRARTQVSGEALRAYYNAHMDQYKVENRVHVEHILFKTIGKTDAEVAEIRQKAEDVLKKAKHGGNFEDLAKKYSEDDATKPKGGDLGWIIEKQTVPEFQQAAFNLPKGAISDLVKTQYGFHIIKVIDHETAHTKTLEEVRSSIEPILLDEKVTAQASTIANQMASTVRQSNRQPIDDLAKKFNLELGETPPAPATDPIGNLGNSPDLHQAVSQLRAGELSAPLQIPQGYVILTVKDIQTAHQGTLAEVRDRVLGDYQQDKSLELAHARAEEFAKRVQAGEAFDKVAKSLELTAKTPEAFSRTGSIPDVGSAKELESAFSMAPGQVSHATQVGGNWLIYRVISHEAASPEDLAKQSAEIEQQLLQAKQTIAFEAFHDALENRLKANGKLTINTDVMKKLTHSS
ncbi:MAG: peptidyl-prolyl cis-trans isomerase, partial [Candidatus Acidiferrales bacterium]